MRRLFTRPAFVMWLCRLGPVPVWSLWAFALVVDFYGGHAFVGSDACVILFVLAGGVHLFLVYSVLPELLYEGRFGSMPRHPGYFFFAGLTAGLGPVIWYWWSVDPALRRMARKGKKE